MKARIEISKCTLPSLIWVIPTGHNSDHAPVKNPDDGQDDR
jgi:hypothetical protein